MTTKKSGPGRPRRAKKKPPEGIDMARECARAVMSKNAQEPLILDISKFATVADYFIICHSETGRQVQAIAETAIEELYKKGAGLVGEEGIMEAKWVVLDWGDVVVHVFEKSYREFYDLERLWIHAEEVPLPEE